MSAGPPPAPGAGLTRDINIKAFPPFRWIALRWRGLVLANTAARREAKAVLFSELAEATRHGMPLETALAMNSQTLRELGKEPEPEKAPGADRRHRSMDILVALVMFFFAQFAFVFYLLVSFRLVDVGRIARLLGLRLHEHIARGLSLSEAMRRCTLDYDEQEIRLAEAGEKWGALPQTLKRLSEFQVTEARLTVQGGQMLYPLWLAAFLATVGSFVMIFIIPKFADIYQQLGAELPMPTQMLVGAGRIIVWGPASVIPLAVAVTGAFFLLRALMNGNRLSIAVMMLPMLLLIPVVFSLLYEIADAGGWGGALLNSVSGLLLLLAVGGLIPFALFTVLIPEVLTGLERLVLRVERRIAPLLWYLPVIGGTARAQLESRWLSAVAVGVESGVSEPEAVRTAGIVCGGKLEKRSARAAGLVAGGLTIGQACLSENVLSSEANHRLVLIDSSSDYIGGLRAIADDEAQAAFNYLNRSGRIAEVVAICLMGVAVGVFAIAMYLPLFNIPNIVGREY